MNFRKYLAESQKVYKYRIKTVLSIDSDDIAVITSFLQRYNPIKIDKPKKSIIQKRPVDFPTIENREVTFIDIELGLPAVTDILVRELVHLLNCPGDFVVVRGEHEPLTIESNSKDAIADIEQQAADKDLTKASLLSTESEYPDADQQPEGSNYYGNSFNSAFLANLQKLSDQHKDDLKVEPPSSLFNWLDLPKEGDPKQDPASFNADIKGPELVDIEKDARKPTPNGNFVDTDVVVKKQYVDRKGNAKTLRTK